MIHDICAQIKTLRKEKGWSQQLMAEKTGLNRTTISAIERGTSGG